MESIFDKKASHDKAKFKANADIKFSAPNINNVNLRIQAMIGKHIHDAKDVSDKDNLANQAQDLVIEALTNNSAKIPIDPKTQQLI